MIIVLLVDEVLGKKHTSICDSHHMQSKATDPHVYFPLLSYPTCFSSQVRSWTRCRAVCNGLRSTAARAARTSWRIFFGNTSDPHEEGGGRRRQKGGGREGEARGDMYPFGGDRGNTPHSHPHSHPYHSTHTRATTHKTTVVVRLRATQKGAAQITRVTLKKKTLYYIRRNDTWSCSVCVYSIPASNE